MDDMTKPEGTPPNAGDDSQTRRMDSPPPGAEQMGGTPPAGQPYMPPAGQQYAPPAGQQYTPPPAAPGYQYNAPPQYNPAPAGGSGYAANPPVRDPTTAMVIEIIAGLVGFLGVGHLLAGRVVPGIILLAGWLIIGIPTIWLFLPLVTCGVGFCLSIPLWIAGPIVSGLWLRGEMMGRPFFQSFQR